jgi:hypothetical protein
MNLPAFSDTLPPEVARLVQACLAHLEQEERVLDGTLQALRQMRAALVRGDAPALSEALAHQDQTARAGQEVRQSRTRLRDELAAALGAPAEAVTLRMFLSHLPEEMRQPLARSRDRLHRLATEVDQFNRGNALVIHHGLSFVQHLLVSLTGGGQSGDCYGPAGKRQEIGCGSLMELRG